MGTAVLDGSTVNLTGTLQVPASSCGLNQGSSAGCAAEFVLDCAQGDVAGPLLFWTDVTPGPINLMNSIDLKQVNLPPGPCTAYLNAANKSGDLFESPTGVPVNYPAGALSLSDIVLTHGSSGAYLLYRLGSGQTASRSPRASVVVRDASHGRVLGRLRHTPEPGTNAVRLPRLLAARLEPRHRYRVSISVRDEFKRTVGREVIIRP